LTARVALALTVGAVRGASAGSAGAEVAREPVGEPVLVSVHNFYTPDNPTETATQLLIGEMKKDPGLQIEPWGGIALPGGWGRASLMMSFAGNTAPDLMQTFFHGIRSDIDQGFLYPLNEWIGDDRNGNGQIDLDEARWDGWSKIPPLWRSVATVNGKVYAVPVPELVYVGIIFRRDLVAAAGLDPNRPPETWDEFFTWCQRMTLPRKMIPGAEIQAGQRGYALTPTCWIWLPWMQAAGSSPVVQLRKSPTTDRVYEFPMDELAPRAPDTGEDLAGVTPEWRANFGSSGGKAAARFYHRLLWAPWIRDPVENVPVDLTEEDVARGTVVYAGRTITFRPDDVIRGVARSSYAGGNQSDMFARGEVAAMQWFERDIENLSRTVGLPAQMIGMFPLPAMDGEHKPVFQIQRHYAGLTQMLANRPKPERDKIWNCLTAITSEDARDISIRRKVILGGAQWCHPADLQRLGLDDYLDDVPEYVKHNFERVDRGEIFLGTEPFIGFWEGAGALLERSVLSLILSVNGQDFDSDTALSQVDRECNSGLMFSLPRETLDRHRPLARVLVGIAVSVVLVLGFLIVRERYGQTGTSGAVSGRLMPWFMLAPALVSIGVWSYYPLLRGAIMAFQDYRIIGLTRWVGLDNFIAVAIDPNTWIYAGKTLKFVALTLGFGFVTPILLAFLLTEIPIGKVFFRTLFFLPQMTSSIVVTMMWGILYDPTENGLLNRMLAGMHLPVQAWLQDPFWAMFCCILPGVWAGAGIGSLIYIAALRSFPDEFYEASALDGAGFFGRIRHIALPQLTPLIVINFVGAFIGAFQGMGSIFLLTFGGPGKETTVLGLAIWQLAYTDLRFSMATTMAWYLGTSLIAFTYLQIRFLRRVEFRRAEEN